MGRGRPNDRVQKPLERLADGVEHVVLFAAVAAEIAQDDFEERQQQRPYEPPFFRGYHMEARGIEPLPRTPSSVVIRIVE